MLYLEYANRAIGLNPSSVGGGSMDKYSNYAWILAFIGCFGAFLRCLPALFKVWIESGGDLRKDLLKRIATLEENVAEERMLCDQKLTRMQTRIDTLTRIFTDAMATDGSNGPIATSLRAAIPIPGLEDLREQLNNIE